MRLSLLPTTDFSKWAFPLLQLLSAAVFMGRGWQLLWGYSPLESSWHWPRTVALAAGVLLMLCALLCGLFHRLKTRSFASPLIAVGAAILLFIALASWQASAFQLAQLIEHSIQWSLPLALLYAAHTPSVHPLFITGLKLAIALTFLGHGLYALGLYGGPPPNFIEMTRNILGVSEQAAVHFLLAAGVLDLLVVAGLFVTGLQYYALGYALLWGTLTALARVFAYFDLAAPLQSLHPWLFECLYRLGHGGLPLYLYGLLALKKEEGR